MNMLRRVADVTQCRRSVPILVLLVCVGTIGNAHTSQWEFFFFLQRLLGNINCRIAVKEWCGVILQERYGRNRGDWHMSVGYGTF